jgi:hypothetical protein
MMVERKRNNKSVLFAFDTQYSNIPLLHQISLMDNGVLDKIEKPLIEKPWTISGLWV